ncbi:MAG: hypothetical protein K8R92_06710 [Planctomycetes bacterium]|nr:hypothetical protein [Planctomycetota bacterium]
MHRTTNAIFALALPLFVASIASAQAYTYGQSFDALPSSGAAADITGTATPPLGSQGALAAISAVDCSWQAARILGTGTAAMKLTVDTGAANTGTVYSYGNTAASNRSLGSIASGTTVPAFGVALTNHSGFTLTTATITFKSQQWRSPSDSSLSNHGVVNTLKFAYGFTPAGMTNANFLSSALMTDEATGNVVSGPNSGSQTASVGLVDLGTNTVTLTGITWNTGDVLYLRWQDANDAANDAGLAIDDFLVTADAGGNPCPMDLDFSGEVDGGDIGLVLLDFGPCPGCSTDLDGSGEVDGGDIGLVLLDFGACP